MKKLLLLAAFSTTSLLCLAEKLEWSEIENFIDTMPSCTNNKPFNKGKSTTCDRLKDTIRFVLNQNDNNDDNEFSLLELQQEILLFEIANLEKEARKLAHQYLDLEKKSKSDPIEQFTENLKTLAHQPYQVKK